MTCATSATATPLACSDFSTRFDDASVFESLLRTAESWLSAQGMQRAIGPFSFSINEETGLLVDGFEHPPAVMMGHALPYYATHVEAAGYSGIKDVLAYSFDNSQELAARAGRHVAQGASNR
jgi:hypothetical protein